jgi:ubiquinone/menaquinone biosynthesis C-methylase UbiE
MLVSTFAYYDFWIKKQSSADRLFGLQEEMHLYQTLITHWKLGVDKLPYHKFYADEAERRRWQNPDSILASIGLNRGFTFVDVGCGYGFFTIPAAKIVGERGRVFALDSDEEAIGSLREKASMQNLRNIEAKVGAAEDTVLCEACANIVFYGIVLHDFRDPSEVLTNAGKMLKHGGRLVDLDWKMQRMEFGPPLNIRFSEEQAVGLIRQAGFRVELRKEIGEFFYLIIAGR